MKRIDEAWFTVEPIDPDTYAISEYGHWEQTHCYLLCGNERALLIDTGLGVADLHSVVGQLTSLPVTVATTHVHWDHIGGHSGFTDLAVHQAEEAWLNGGFPLPPAVVRHNLTCKPCNFPAGFDPQRYQVFQGPPQRIFTDNDCFDLGGRSVQVVHTPGHSPGHSCFYEPDRRYLYSGDLIYQGCLDAFYPTTDPLAFWRSVQRVQTLSVERLLPGHYSLKLSVALIDQIEAAFAALAQAGKLHPGSGLFEFDAFRIHI